MFNTDHLGWDHLIQGISGRLIQGELNRKAQGVSTDTRTLQAGNLFVALKGPHFNGQTFLSQAFEKGAAAALVSEPFPPGVPASGKAIILVKDTLTALGDLASLWRGLFPVVLTGISGSNGKTTAKDMLASILQSEGPTLKNPGNLNNWVGLPLSLFSLQAGIRFAVMEMGMNRAGEIARLCRIAKPAVGLLTSIGPAHLEGLGSLEAITQAKGELFEALGPGDWAIINQDDFRIKELAQTCRARKMTFGLDPGAQVQGRLMDSTPEGFRFRILFQGEEQEVFLKMQGGHNIVNALGAAAAALALGLSLTTVRKGLEQASLPEHRLQLRKGVREVRLIDDTYNANPASLIAALSTFQSLRKADRGGLVLGDMLELGEQAGPAHQEIGALIGEMGIDYLLTLGPLSQALLEKALKGSRPPAQAFQIRTQEEAVQRLMEVMQPGDWVLVKGSHGLGMEAVVRSLEKEAP
jgi:UDP-N-acetylmuramoyl-tripeptide--D-alanyl-D-alanine ligase